MINANEARSLFVLPQLLEQEVEAQIREAAETRDYTCFKAAQMNEHMIARLKASGFEVSENNGDVIVYWRTAEPRVEVKSETGSWSVRTLTAPNQ